MYKMWIMMAGLLISQAGFCHEGHDEPKKMPSPKGGVTRMNENYYFEYVYQPAGGTVYLYKYDLTPAPVAGVEVSANFEIPRKAKVEAKLTAIENAWKIEAALPKTHRLTLKLKVNDKGHSDTFKFVVEPK